MSKETEKVLKDLYTYLEENSGEDRTKEDVERLIKEFMSDSNNRIPETVTEETAESSDDYLELACAADNTKDALKYAKKSLKLDPYNFDAERVAIDLKSKDSTELVQNLAKAVQKASKHMEEEGFFEDDCVGHFWGLLETRPYMRLRARYVQELIECGMIGRAREECIELLRLCEGDNLGIRYRLMHIYAYLEEEEAALALHRQYGSYDETEMLLPLSILYYKKENYTKAERYLRRLYGENKDLKRFLRMVTEDSEAIFDGFGIGGGYRPGTIEELMVEAEENAFLFVSAGIYMEWALQKVKKIEKKQKGK